MLNVFDGTNWKTRDSILLWNGTAWVRQRPYYYAGDDLGWQPDPVLVGNYSVSTMISRTIAAPSSPKPPSPPPVQTYTKTVSLRPAWVTSYAQGGSQQRNPQDGNLYQGQYSGTQGMQSGMAGFNFGSFPAGAKATACRLTLTANHWYSNSGGIAVIGTHRNATAPGSLALVNEGRINYSWNAKSGTRTIDLGTGIGNEFITGFSKGIVVGRAPNTSQSYYGYFAGTGGYAPVVEVTYQWAQ